MVIQQQAPTRLPALLPTRLPAYPTVRWSERPGLCPSALSPLALSPPGSPLGWGRHG